MTPDEAEAIAGLEHIAGALGIRLPRSVPALLGASLLWPGGAPLHNSLTPGFPPVEYSFSTWQPEEFRVATQLFATLSASERRARTVDLAGILADRSLLAASLLRDACASSPSTARRFGAFFGMTAGTDGLTGLEVYLEVVEGEERLPWLPSPLHEALNLALRAAFTGIGIRHRTVTRRAYFAVTCDLETDVLLRALQACGPSSQVGGALDSLGHLISGRHVLPASTVMVSSRDDASMSSVELHAMSYGLDVVSLQDHLVGLRTAAFGRWASAVGGRRAFATVVSIRFSKRYGPGIAVYAVPAWARQPASSTSSPMTCPLSSTDSARALPVADPDLILRARNPAT